MWFLVSVTIVVCALAIAAYLWAMNWVDARTGRRLASEHPVYQPQPLNAHGYPLSLGNGHRGCTDINDPGPCDCLCHRDPLPGQE